MLTPFDERVLSEVKIIYINWGAPARTSILQDFTRVGERSIRRSLCKLERHGFVRRIGQRGGWMPIRKFSNN